MEGRVSMHLTLSNLGVIRLQCKIAIQVEKFKFPPRNSRKTYVWFRIEIRTKTWLLFHSLDLFKPRPYT